MPTPKHRVLHNTSEVELWPAHLLRAHGNRDARQLSQASHVLRRKTDGCYLAAVTQQGIVGLLPRWQRAPGIDEALDLIGAGLHTDVPMSTTPLPLSRVEALLDRLGLASDTYAARTGLALVAEPAWLTLAGFDRYRRPLWLDRATALAWNAMQRAAWADDVLIEAVSGYRSHDYQLGIFARKFARGLTLEAILEVNAAPGYSEHHSGSALDISAPGEPAAETSFEDTAAFAWLHSHAAQYGFSMSFPRDNPHGIVYEPWHWRYRGAQD